MKYYIYAIVASLVLSPSLLLAQEQNLDELCKTLIAHEPAPDVEYMGGYDVHGNKVIGADLYESVVEIPKYYSFVITSDQMVGLGFDETLSGKMPIGTVTFRNNRVFFNGKPLEGMDVENLKVLCIDKP